MQLFLYQNNCFVNLNDNNVLSLFHYIFVLFRDTIWKCHKSQINCTIVSYSVVMITNYWATPDVDVLHKNFY